MTTSEPRWLELLRAEAARTSIQALAARIQYSRSAVSLVLAGKYPGNTSKIEVKALAVLEPALNVSCPYLGTVIAVVDCRQYASQRAPTHNPVKMNHWRACHQCPNHKKESD